MCKVIVITSNNMSNKMLKFYNLNQSIIFLACILYYNYCKPIYVFTKVVFKYEYFLLSNFFESNIAAVMGKLRFERK